jgi:hypothetical protein
VALNFRTQLFRANFGIDEKPTEDKTDLYARALEAEFTNFALTQGEAEDKKHIPKINAMINEEGKGVKGKDGKGDEKGKRKGKEGNGYGRRICYYFTTSEGCKRGYECSFHRPPVLQTRELRQ